MQRLYRCAAPAIFALLVVKAAATAGAMSGAVAPAVPSWVFPLNPPSIAPSAAANPSTVVHLANSDQSFTRAQLTNLFSTPDWHPNSHPAMPDVVARGRPPDVYACGFCHMPAGQGRPENASLAGLPADYIVRQVAEFRSGARRGAGGDSYLPTNLMMSVARHVPPEDVVSAAAYFSQLRLAPRVVVLERARVPRTRVSGWIYVAEPGQGEEPLGDRLIELTTDLAAHENRDDTLRYVAYVPPGSLARGEHIARLGALTAPCVLCHGAALHGVGIVPSLAGRSPTYLLRQLLAFQSGVRAGELSGPMRDEVAKFSLRDMIAVAAYAGSLPAP